MSAEDSEREPAASPWRYTQETFREPHFPSLWISNFIHFSAWNAQSVILQWLVTGMTDSRTALGALSFVQGIVLIVGSPATSTG